MGNISSFILKSNVTMQVCTGLYRLCLGSAANGGHTGLHCIGPVLAILLQYLDEAQLMKPHRWFTIGVFWFIDW